MSGADLRRLILLILPPVAAGSALRLWGLGDQVLGGDEIHAIRAAIERDLPEILTTYRPIDHCIPLTAYLELLLMAGARLTEFWVRLPSVLSGLLALALLPWMVASELGGRTATAFSWLVALSPILIYYSRLGRPYAVIVLFTALAAACFWRFWEAGDLSRGTRAAWAFGYAISAATATWFHPAAGPFVAAPILFGAIDVTVRRLPGRPRRRPPARSDVVDLVSVTLLLAAGVGAFLLPASRSFLRVLEIKAESRPPNLDTLVTVGRLFSGSVAPTVTVVFWVLAVAGLTALWRKRQRLASYTVVLVVTQVVGLMAMRPTKAHMAVVAGRYGLITLPVVLLWVAVGVAALWFGYRTRGRALALGNIGYRLSVIGLVAALVATHPYRIDPAVYFGPFAGSMAALRFHLPAPELPDSVVPGPYFLLRREPGSEPIVPLPSESVWASVRLDLALWRIHRRPVILTTAKPFVDDPRVQLRTLVGDTPEAIAGTNARFVVLQMNRGHLWGLQEAVRAGRWREGMPEPKGVDSSLRTRRMSTALSRGWGPPHLSGSGVRLWDLTRLEQPRPSDSTGTMEE